MSTLMPDSNILIIGRRRTGKSVLIKDIFYHKRTIPSGIVFSGTEAASPFFEEFIPSSYIYSDYDNDLMTDIFEAQKTRIRKERQKEGNEGKTPMNNFFIVFDDLQADAKSWNRQKTFQELYMNGRHFNIFSITALQYTNGISPGLRSNIDYVFMFNEASVDNRKKLYANYGSVIPTFGEFCNILDSCTANHECLVIKLTGGASNNLADMVFWYKADLHKPFKVGSKSYWQRHEECFNNNHVEQEAELKQKLSTQKSKYNNSNKLKILVDKKGNLEGHYV